MARRDCFKDIATTNSTFQGQLQVFVTPTQTFCKEKLFQTAVLTHSPSVSIQWELQAVCIASKIFLPSGYQLKSSVHLRINLSPFTKDFRVRETPIEDSSYIYQASYGEAILLTTPELAAT